MAVNREAEQRVIAAARAVLSHWREFGPGYDFEEVIEERLAPALDALAALPPEAPAAPEPGACAACNRPDVSTFACRKCNGTGRAPTEGGERG